MIHKIKALYNGGEGSSIRAISKQLGISRNTTRKYLQLNEQAITKKQSECTRSKMLDDHRDYIVYLLHTYPQLSAVKVMRKLLEKIGEVNASDRSMRRYIHKLKATITSCQRRYYEPILAHVPGVQCQVDPGELRGVMIGGIATTVYFVVFVLSYSRLMYVGVSRDAINTERFIKLHDAALRYFGGRPEECVYDQTKLVVISEIYRELTLNQRFHQYATGAGFQIRACEGYDPESKGKVESGVKYVKQNALYGESFDSWQALEQYLVDWLNNIANKRLHATTGKQPQQHYDSGERAHMKPYLQPACLSLASLVDTRQADKTGLVSWLGSKYSVPMNYQCAQVGAAADNGELVLTDLNSDEIIARHKLSTSKGAVIKNRNHYRDKSLQIADYEQAIQNLLGEELGQSLCQRLKMTSPTIYKDQLSGLKQVLTQHSDIPLALLAQLAQRAQLKVSQIRDYLAIHATNPERLEALDSPTSLPAQTKVLAEYSDLGCTSATEGSHELH
ncbi:MAG: IS21 family transposase [Gammaproteobacteria bacterium]